jgi:hypothetical protein
MFKFKFSDNLTKEQEIQDVLSAYSKLCKDITNKEFIELDICDYKYTTDEAVKELCIDQETIAVILNEYIKQVFESLFIFEIMLKKLKLDSSLNKELDFTKIQELAHKNLGVARNLRIKDAEKLLTIVMHNKDLELIEICLDMLQFTTIKLDPDMAYNMIKEIINKGFEPKNQSHLIAI